ncbi:MAG: hypothetical protein AB7I27_10175 [Bacteriovoracaceae bacterium]
MLLKYSPLLLLFILIPLFSGCVGTVQDTAQSYTQVADSTGSAITFNGIQNASAVSDTRIEVFFYPASGGSGKYTYDITISGYTAPISVTSETLSADYRGLLKYTISGLTRLTTYQIKIDARDSSTDATSNSQVVKTVVTFENKVCDFGGISTASNLPGQNGKDSIKIRWTPARISGQPTEQDWDPRSYEAIFVEAEKLTPNDMDEESYGPTQGRYVFRFNHSNTANEYIARGLPSNTRFYIRMRAIHAGSVTDVYNPGKRSELNTNYITISTLSDSLADINFQPDSFALTLAAGSQGLNAITASWAVATGVFDHYRLYYSMENGGVAAGNLPALCLSPLVSDPAATVFCKKVDSTLNSAAITGLTPYTTYEVVLVLCQTSDCGSSERLTASVKTITTDPTSPTFDGLSEVVSATSLADLGTVKLKFAPPNFTQGYFDGLIIQMRRTKDGSDTPVEITESSTTVYNDSYNFLTSNEVKINGIDYLSNTPYYFTLYPYKWSSDGLTRREFPNNVWLEFIPEIKAPTNLEFLGLRSGNTYLDQVTLNWTSPEQGVYAEYELFWRKSSLSFSWGDAIAQTGAFNYTNYGRQIINSSATSITLNGFADGDYAFGIITHYTYVTDDGVVTLRSETNSNILKCTIDYALADTVDCSY